MENHPGGKGGNQAGACAKLGMETLMVGQVGTDSGADFMRGHLSDAGVTCSLITAVEGPTGTAVILLQPDGENSIIIVGGANTAPWELTREQKDAITGAGVVLLQCEIPQAVNLQVAQVAKAAGVPVILDCGGADDPLDAELLSCITTLSPNETELARLTGQPTDTMGQVVGAAFDLLARGVSNVLVKRGKLGSLLLQASGDVIKQGVVPVDKVVDTTGAGDSYTAGYAVATLRGLGSQDAMLYAAAVASICIQRSGAMSSLPTGEEVDALFKKLRDGRGE